MESAAAHRQGAGTQRSSHSHLEEEDLAVIKKKPVRKGAPLSSSTRADESAAPSLSHLGAARAGPGAGVQLQLEEPVGGGGADGAELLFPSIRWIGQRAPSGGVSCALVRHIPRPLLVVWDGLPPHRSRLVRDYIESLQGRIELAYLPPYAPELNPVEYIWAHWKHHELPNVCPKDYWQLSEAARRTLRRMRRRPRLITAFWKQSSLWPE